MLFVLRSPRTPKVAVWNGDIAYTRDAANVAQHVSGSLIEISGWKNRIRRVKRCVKITRELTEMPLARDALGAVFW